MASGNFFFFPELNPVSSVSNLHRQAVPHSGTRLPQKQPPPPFNRAALYAEGALPKTASSPLQSSSSTQRGRASPQKRPSSPLQSSSSTQRDEPPPETASSPLQSSSSTQRDGTPPETASSPPSIKQPHAAGALPETASSPLHQSSSSAQRELPQKQPPR